MLPLTRRNFAGACVAAGAFGPLEALARTVSSPAADAPDARPPVVDLVGDGIPLSPAEDATLLARLAQGGLLGDEYSRGGAVEALEAQFAKLLGTEAAVSMPTGTLANHLAVRALAGPRRRVAVRETSHLYNGSGDCAQTLSALNLVPLSPGEATFRWEDVDRLLARTASGRVATAVGAISIESPVRRLRNQAFDFAEMERISKEAHSRGIGLHLDGARLFAAAARSLWPTTWSPASPPTRSSRRRRSPAARASSSSAPVAPTPSGCASTSPGNASPSRRPRREPSGLA